MATEAEKRSHGLLLKAAMAAKRMDRRVVADATGRSTRTITHWTSGATMPSEAEKNVLRRLLGDYDSEGDAVELALRRSALHPYRQTKVLALYQELLHEQEREASA